MFIFGGRGEGGGKKGSLLRDLYMLDLDEWCWVQVNPTTTSPAARFEHAETVVGSKIVVFGGWDGRRCFNDLWIFDTEAFTWMTPKTAGTPPSPRHGGQIQLFPDGRLFIFGGHAVPDPQNGIKAAYHADARVLDTETMVWSRPRITGKLPSGRYGHSLCRVGNHVALVGGWAGVRRSMVFEYLPVPDNFEERDVSMLSDYLHFLNIETMDWSAPAFTGVDHPHRYGHSCTLVGEYLFVFGGWDGNRPLGELQVLNMAEVADRLGQDTTE